MRSIFRHRIAAVAAVAVVLAGGTFAAVSATGQVRTRPRTRTANAASAQSRAPRHRGRNLAAAARYLGLTRAQLRGDLQSGRTLTQVAASIPGKSAKGLIDAIVAVQRARLTKRLDSIDQRVTAEVTAPGATQPASAASAGHHHHHHHGRHARRATSG